MRKAQAPIYSVSAFNIERNQEVGKVIVDSNEINGLLPGLKIFFDNTLGLRLDPQPPVSIGGGANTLNSFAYPLPIERPVISLVGQGGDLVRPRRPARLHPADRRQPGPDHHQLHRPT